MSDIERIVSRNHERRKAADKWACQVEEADRMYRNARRRVRRRRAVRKLVNACYVASGAFAALAAIYAATGLTAAAVTPAIAAAAFAGLAWLYGEDAE